MTVEDIAKRQGEIPTKYELIPCPYCGHTDANFDFDCESEYAEDNCPAVILECEQCGSYSEAVTFVEAIEKWNNKNIVNMCN